MTAVQRSRFSPPPSGPSRPPHPSRWPEFLGQGLPADVLRILGVAAVYYGSGRVGLLEHVNVEGAVVTPLWPPTGVALSCLLLMGLRIWPGIALGTFGVILTLKSSFDAAGLVILAGNTLSPVVAWLLLRRVGFRTELDRLRDGLALVFLGALAGMLISATIGPCLMLVLGQLETGSFWPVWSAWWAGDAMGVLVFTPLLLTLRRFRLPHDPWRVAEGAALAAVACVVVPVATRSEQSVLFLVFPLLIWAALRFQLAGSAPCAALVSIAATTAATRQEGPFHHHTFMEGMVTLQAFNGATALTALLLAAMVTEQLNIRNEVERACLELTEIVDHLSRR